MLGVCGGRVMLWVPSPGLRGTHPAGLQDQGALGAGGVASGGATGAACPLIPAAGPHPEQEALGAGSPAFGEEEEEKDLNKALGVERFEEILNDAHPRNAEEAGRSYSEEDFECERGQGRARSGERAGSGQGGKLGVGNGQEMGREHSTNSQSPQTTASRPTTSTTRSPRTCPLTPGARRGSRKRAKRRPGVPLSPERPPPSRRPKKMRMTRVTRRRSGRRRSCGSPGQPRQCR